MNMESPTAIHAHGSRPAWRAVAARLLLTTLTAVSALGLSGCRAVEAIFKVGAWFGALVVILIVAVIGGAAAMILRKA